MLFKAETKPRGHGMTEDLYDLLVVGGGINGVGIARDAAGRGLKVLLCEQHDLASATSSASTKLIHGGLRYLEHFAFGLVRESLTEREILLHAAPHIVRPLRFVVPHCPEMRPMWMIRLGLFLYDHLARRQLLPSSSRVDAKASPPEMDLDTSGVKGFEYSDCRVDDSRLVVLSALDAAERGAHILPRTRCQRAVREDGLWRAGLLGEDGAQRQVRARALAVVAGPWVNRFLSDALEMPAKAHARLVKGSHIVVPRLYEGEQAYLLQNEDGRIVFVIPYEEKFSLIGTTEVEHPSDPAVETITPAETDYLCEAVGRFFHPPLDPADIVWSFSGLRPLFDDAKASASSVTRDYRLALEASAGQAPLLTVFGGKLTTYRRLAEHALDRFAKVMEGVGPPWTHDAHLPGGDLGGRDFEDFVQDVAGDYPWLPQPLARRYAGAYGSRVQRLLADARSLEDLGLHLGSGLYEAEVRYLRQNEWAHTARDILWRRSKLGLHVSGATVENLEMWLATN
jgi:glycerol-3-phosphate dehydrogenase